MIAGDFGLNKMSIQDRSHFDASAHGLNQQLRELNQSERVNLIMEIGSC